VAYYLTAHASTSEARRIRERHHTTTLAATARSTGETLADLSCKGDFGFTFVLGVEWRTRPHETLTVGGAAQARLARDAVRAPYVARRRNSKRVNVWSGTADTDPTVDQKDVRFGGVARRCACRPPTGSAPRWLGAGLVGGVVWLTRPCARLLLRSVALYAPLLCFCRSFPCVCPLQLPRGRYEKWAGGFDFCATANGFTLDIKDPVTACPTRACPADAPLTRLAPNGDRAAGVAVPNRGLRRDLIFHHLRLSREACGAAGNGDGNVFYTNAYCTERRDGPGPDAVRQVLKRGWVGHLDGKWASVESWYGAYGRVDAYDARGGFESIEQSVDAWN